MFLRAGRPRRHSSWRSHGNQGCAQRSPDCVAGKRSIPGGVLLTQVRVRAPGSNGENPACSSVNRFSIDQAPARTLAVFREFLAIREPP